MPTYEYKCAACDYEFEAFHAMSAKSLVICPECGKSTLLKLIGMGSAVIVKGTETPCRGGRKQQMHPKDADKLGEGKNKDKKPFWRDGKINKKILKNPEKYIKEGEID